MRLTIGVEKEANDLWTAELMEIPGAVVHGVSRADAICNAERLAIVVIEDRKVHGEMCSPDPT